MVRACSTLEEAAMTAEHNAISESISGAAGSVLPGIPTHVVVASFDHDLVWSVFNTFEPNPEVRVTGCSTMTQARFVCATDPPQVVVLDMRLLSEDPLGLVNLANTARAHTHIVALSDHSVFEVGARFGKARLSFIQMPGSAQNLELLLRLKLDEDLPLAAHVC
jgi:DNA-binding NtrC family response regulator